MVTQMAVPVLVLAAIVLAVTLVRMTMTRLEDGRNVAEIVRHYGCSHEDAVALYRRARLVGFGAAYRAMFGRRPIPPQTRVTGAPFRTANHSAHD